jgi:hypothetical protein
MNDQTTETTAPTMHSTARDTMRSLRREAAKLEEDARQLERGLATYDFDGSEDARARIQEARKHLRWAADDLDAASEQYRDPAKDEV